MSSLYHVLHNVKTFSNKMNLESRGNKPKFVIVRFLLTKVKGSNVFGTNANESVLIFIEKRKNILFSFGVS